MDVTLEVIVVLGLALVVVGIPQLLRHLKVICSKSEKCTVKDTINYVEELIEEGDLVISHNSGDNFVWYRTPEGRISIKIKYGEKFEIELNGKPLSIQGQRMIEALINTIDDRIASGDVKKV